MKLDEDNAWSQLDNKYSWRAGKYHRTSKNKPLMMLDIIHVTLWLWKMKAHPQHREAAYADYYTAKHQTKNAPDIQF